METKKRCPMKEFPIAILNMVITAIALLFLVVLALITGLMKLAGLISAA
jgi:hypothetical protein